MAKDTKFHTLTATVVDGRPGYANHRGQTYATPVSSKRLEAWKQRMIAKGYKLGGA